MSLADIPKFLFISAISGCVKELSVFLHYVVLNVLATGLSPDSFYRLPPKWAFVNNFFNVFFDT